MNPPNGTVNSVRVEIYDQAYNLRGTDPDYIFKLAEYVDGKMRAVAEQTSTVESLRLAVLAALNIADEFHLLKRKYDTIANEMNQRTNSLANALDEVLQDSRRAG
ncbi:MAG: cell division protein ZapA [Acidobacteriia bacterium]|nr:cell division protein ZapA [Terriglobia bacterium]